MSESSKNEDVEWERAYRRFLYRREVLCPLIERAVIVLLLICVSALLISRFTSNPILQHMWYLAILCLVLIGVLLAIDHHLDAKELRYRELWRKKETCTVENDDYSSVS
ncbi:MAG: hypothetical protein JO011_18430 [Ktedonobacteraceae bacterium]|nr:hypothetical protein [Ktedonobacteraceae bacterium]MBV9712882.1 hypothetical protein [Ktedonobacteraceae bacterium]